MPESDARNSEPQVPATPRVSGELSASSSAAETPVPRSSMRAAQLPEEPSVVSEPGDTLLSAGKPAELREVLLDDRLSVVDRRLAELDARLAALEGKRPLAPPTQRHKPWLWLAFLLGLVVVFQLLRRVR